MADIVFLTGVDDKIGYALRLLRKKYREGARVAVFGPALVLQKLDHLLWSEDKLSFLPHVRLRGDISTAVRQRTRLWLLDRPEPGLDCDTAVNLGLDEVAPLCEFSRVAEIVSTVPQDRALGRERWKRYESLGQTPKHVPHTR